ncbi:hypothetical protein LCGC14_2336300 [marine sediment metagenome]|uniref:Uncharacterized protein n=1 Tax=marine sediment metagenome TaxID=412755 RepID=A0A0F9F8E8_9ZZZZ
MDKEYMEAIRSLPEKWVSSKTSLRDSTEGRYFVANPDFPPMIYKEGQWQELIYIKPSLEQELEAGLAKHGYESEQGEGSCAYIYLPMAKYKEWQRHMNRHSDIDSVWSTFHDIPVYSYSGDKIKYCSCE